MNKIEKEFAEAVSDYFAVKEQLENLRQKIKGQPLSAELTKYLAGIVSDRYNCRWYISNQGGVTFVDDINDKVNTRRFDALKFWRRAIMGLEQ